MLRRPEHVDKAGSLDSRFSDPRRCPVRTHPKTGGPYPPTNTHPANPPLVDTVWVGDEGENVESGTGPGGQR